jgi:hypothetical protein
MLLAFLAYFGPLVEAQFLPAGSCPSLDPLNYTVLLQNPTNCSKFFSCSNGVPIELYCPAGLHFNDKLKVCDWPQNVNCVPRKLSRLCSILFWVSFFVAQQSNSDLGRLIAEVSSSHTVRRAHTHRIGLLWKSDQHVAGADTYATNTRDEHPCPQRDSNSRVHQSSESRPTT